jgi:catechol 2,3-dioxygenase-like lactoylglutathione lyase family enzyme
VSELPKSIGAITLFVADIERAKEFYGRAFEAGPVYEDEVSGVFQLDNTIINLLQSSAANELIAPAAVGAADAGSRFQLTIWVKDADGACAGLAERGIELLNGPLDRAWGVRTAAFADPDGHIWEVAQQLGSAAA